MIFLKKSFKPLFILVLGLIVFIFGCQVSSNDSVDTEGNGNYYYIVDYSPFAQGNIWTYRFSAWANPYSKTVSGTEMCNGVETVKVEDDDGGYELWSNTDGIVLYKSVESNGPNTFVTTFNPPVTMIPARIEIGDTHTFNSNFTVELSGNPVNNGTYSGEVTIIGFENITTPAGTFNNCLKVVTNYTWTFAQLPSISNTSTLWLARDVGDVYEVIEDNIGNSNTDILISAVINGIAYP